jgi:hypothetical protein
MTDMGAGRNAEVDSATERDLPTSEINVRGEQMKEVMSKRPVSEERVQTRLQPSPAPFSRYQTSVEHEDLEERSRLPAGLTTADHGRIVHGEDESNEGCCKCVIM